MKLPAKYRAAVYIGAPIALALVLTLKIVAPGTVDAFAENLAYSLGIVASVLALLNVTPD